MRRAPKRLAGALSLSIAAALMVFGVAPASATDPTFPTWADVQKAEGNAAAKQAEIATITKLISGMQAQSAAAGKNALIAGEKYNQAEAALSTATATAQALATQAASAKKKASASSKEAGQLAAQLAREGYGNIGLTLFLNSGHASSLLDRIGTMTQLSATSARIFATAEQNRKTAAALGSQASAAQAVQATRATAAKADYSTAQAAANTSKASVFGVTAQQKTLTAQLASLNGMTASVEAEYLAGVAWEAKQAAQTKPPAAPPTPI